MGTITAVEPKIYLVIAPSQYILAATFMRFQEYYESSEFKGRIFAVEEYMDWYAKYFEDWHGFNVPAHAFDPFLSHKFDPLTKKEQILIDKLHKSGLDLLNDYVIGLTERDVHRKPTLEHEYTHGLLAKNKHFRDEMVAVIMRYHWAPISKILEEMSYDKSVWLDEVIAYFLTGPGKEFKAIVGEYREMRFMLGRTFKHVCARSTQYILDRVHVIKL
ncbi:MAG: hypothetical protein UT53_C0005G0009 [Candidatus Yanofskybacteria bacterium GW2011_GWD2_39_48]|uniref:Uncharacterized protein n=1 Tax=Candidatus Yanofskybacteria bacterium GW2011_GWD2_39_48 TaxID=1619031 RepID=A0A0G0P7C7_9BACT|nr:MAG: hypothetical protein UT53_C0005G0009 [Candidatus Yanofskybacteria bacterium GW2011_GWD2_39_48]